MDSIRLLEQATAHHVAGRLGDARALYRDALAIAPDDANLMFRLGMLDMQGGALADALGWIDAAIARSPGEARYRIARGHVFAAAGQPGEALAAYQQAHALDPTSADPLFALGTTLQAAGEPLAAIEAYEAVLAREPARADALNNLGNCHRVLGDTASAEAAYRRAIALQPGDVDALTNLGTLAIDAGRLEEALPLLETALHGAPDSPCALANLGVALHRHREFARSAAVLARALELDPAFPEASYNLANALHALGRRDEAVAHYRQAIALVPAHADAYNNLGVTLREAGATHEAVQAFGTAIALRPGFVAALNNLATAHRTLGAMDAAHARLREALAAAPDHAVTLNNLGNVLKDQGRLAEGVAYYRRAIEADPGNVVAHGNLLYALSFVAEDPLALREEGRRWSARHEAPLAGSRRPHANDATPSRRLRLGYVSPDFRHHCQALFMQPLLSHHDHDAFEIVCYASVARPDAQTHRLAALADVWRDVSRLDDAQLARTIRDDRIDVLVDLSMHMADSRPLLFARKPAPVQIAWLAYPGSTGIEAIDYRLTDPRLDPPGTDAFYSERSIRLPDTFWCYDPLVDAADADTTLAVGPLPALANGHVTFGCLNNPCKLDDASLRMWRGAMDAVPDARLLLMLPEGEARPHLLARLAAQGIAAGRVGFTAFRPRAEYLRTYQGIDIGLDTLPYNGHTTSLDAYWMGVPVITRAGSTVAGRAGLSQATHLGLLDCVADSDARFAEIAAGLARDLPRLAALRAGLRARLAASPLMDGARFAAGFEAACREAWHGWCRAQNA